MTKFFFFWLLLTATCIVQAQVQDSTDRLLKVASIKLIEKKFDFQCPAGSLESAIKKLSAEQKIKFSYSDNRIENIAVPIQQTNNKDLNVVLHKLLTNTGFTFILVGRIVVIVPDERKVILPPEKTANDPKLVPPARIYAEDRFFAGQPESIKREIRKIYQQELKFVRHNNHTQSKADSSKNESTPKPSIAKILPLIKIESGFRQNEMQFKDIGTNSWRTDLDWHNSISNSVWLSVQAGIKLKRFFIEGGIGYYNFKMSSSGVMNTSYVIYEAIGKSGKFKVQEIFQSTAFEIKHEFSVFSIPVSCLYLIQYKQLYAGFGPEFQLQFINTKVTSEKIYSDYYVAQTGANYSSKNDKMGFVAGFKFEAGYINDKFSIGAGANIQQRLTPYSQNSLYSFTGSSFTVDLSIRYFLKKRRN